MAYSLTIRGYENNSSSYVYNTESTIIDTSLSTYLSSIRDVIPKYSKLVRATVSCEIEKGWSLTKGTAYFKSYPDSSKIGDTSNLSNGTNTGKTANVTGLFQSETAEAGQFTSAYTGIGLYCKDAGTPIIFVIRDKCLIYSYEKPTCTLNAYLPSGDTTGGYLIYQGQDFGPQATGTFEVDINSQTHSVVAIPREGYYCTGWKYGSGLDNITTISGNTLTFTFNHDSINAFSTISQYYTEFLPYIYSITWKNYDGTTIVTTTGTHWSRVDGGGIPTSTPTRPPDANYHYVFSGWDTALDTIVTGPMTITAQYIAIPHTYTYTLTAEGRRNNQCTDCAHYYLERPYDLCQENLFHFSDWAESSCAKMNTGTLEYSIPNGTITITGTGDSYTMYGGSSDYYHVPIEPGEEYIFSYNILTTGTKQAFVFFYDANGTAVNGVGISQPHIGHYDGTPITFTAPETATQLAIRVGVRDTSTATFSNIIVCKTKHKRSLDETTTLIRRTYFADQSVSKIGNSSTVSLTDPIRKGFDFINWFNDENYSTELSLPFNLSSSKTIYPQWFERKGFSGDKTVKVFEGKERVKVFLGSQKLF